jgi:hypothetical protein
VETATQKLARTVVNAIREGKTDRVAAIELGGSTTTIELSAKTGAQSGT